MEPARQGGLDTGTKTAERYVRAHEYVIFAVLLYILTIAGLYSLLPALYAAAAGLIEVWLLCCALNYTGRGLITVLLGVPVHTIWRKKAAI
jgi:hypothetical protein